MIVLPFVFGEPSIYSFGAMGIRASIDPDAIALALDYAKDAASNGWSDASLARFCDKRGMTLEMRRALFPKGARSVSWRLNDAADIEMLSFWRDTPAPSFAAIIDKRFADNADLKRAVGRLARSDLLHPIDTISRTARTAKHMFSCRGHEHASALETWTLVLVYSLCVLIWLSDATSDQRRTHKATRALLRLVGAR